jgi:hypothetical protein
MPSVRPRTAARTIPRTTAGASTIWELIACVRINIPNVEDIVFQHVPRVVHISCHLSIGHPTGMLAAHATTASALATVSDELPVAVSEEIYLASWDGSSVCFGVALVSAG